MVEPTIEQVREALYIQDCHVSGMHDPTHTSSKVCELQLMGLAKRILAVFGIGWEGLEGEAVREAVNQIPRRIDRKGWYAYYADPSHKCEEKARELERWEREGLLPKEIG